LVHCFTIPRCRSSLSLVLIHWFFKFKALGLGKILYVFLLCTLPALQSRIVTNQNFVLLCLNYFRLDYTVGRGLVIACNTFRMLVFFCGVLFFAKICAKFSIAKKFDHKNTLNIPLNDFLC
jgi:hypothetical protein